MTATNQPFPPVTIRAENFRALANFEWTPAGVCALVGPNGSGKSTALLLIEVLRRSFERDMIAGLAMLGSGPLASLDSPKSAPQVTLSTAGASWKVGVERTAQPYETAVVDGRGVYTVAAASGSSASRVVIVTDTTTDVGLPRPQSRFVLCSLEEQFGYLPSMLRLGPIFNTLRGSRYYARPRLDHLRSNGSVQSTDPALETDATNLFTVLRTWRDLSEHNHRYQFVVERMASIFPREFKQLDFVQAGPRVFASVVTGRWTDKLQPTDWSDGFFASLIHLTSLASCGPGAIVAIDEPENSLHPALIRELITAMRDWSAQHSVTVICATHSPAVLDQFADEPEQVYVMEPGRPQLPVPLDKLRKKEWLKHYALGDLYSHSEVGAPT